MISRRALFLVFTAPLALHAASQEQEYQQVRTIALRDPKVRAAYAAADRRLEEKIVKIDPALEGYVKRRNATGPEPTTPRKVIAQTAPKKFERSHVVLKGETLSSIASIFGVTVPALKAANRIEDERKLQVGQNLAIPERTR